nr:hypothetical protein [Bacillus licheniformis]
MSSYRSVEVSKGPGGFGGPLVITPDEERNKIVYVTGGNKPDFADHLAELTGCTLVDGFKTTVPESEMAAVIIDCGGTPRPRTLPAKANSDDQCDGDREKRAACRPYYRRYICFRSKKREY